MQHCHQFPALRISTRCGARTAAVSALKRHPVEYGGSCLSFWRGEAEAVGLPQAGGQSGLHSDSRPA